MQKLHRNRTKQISLGGVAIGGGAAVVVQSMTNTLTHDIAATLNQIRSLAEAGCELARLAVPDQRASAALPELVKKSPLPLIADIHFSKELALSAVDAGIAGLRLNPGNLRSPVAIREVAKAAEAAGIPIRVGVNAGSLDPDLLLKHGGPTPEALVESALGELRLLEDAGLTQMKVSAKVSSAMETIATYRLLARQTDWPLH
ncbi:flavodoxin-dependent (E)-4-hydroxy-3-methylbut-2-enyl-diphosphate synthase, partial [bacterium]|nr:flavodoxin-dependent (E)-4-hydroxy-3-methylbut-2-enyl-diphosphate synthase [bacterium]